jgi:hypothetical protein
LRQLPLEPLRRHRQRLVVALSGHAPHVAAVGEDARFFRIAVLDCAEQTAAD